MFISSLSFLLAIIVFSLVVRIIARSKRWWLFLLASIYFYFSLKPEYPLIIFVSIIINYFFSKAISSSNNSKKWLFGGVSLNLLMLIVFKYLDFFSSTVNSIIKSAGLEFTIGQVNLLLPLGISFYTFSCLSYLVDVYNKRYNYERNFLIFGANLLFFPKILSGPIERVGNFIPKLLSPEDVDHKVFFSGLLLIVWGMFKKVIVADRIAVMVSIIFSSPAEFSGIHLILGAFLFGFQLYLDFSGYTDIAIGSSKMVGVSLTPNFKRPFLSKSVSDFWKRWHISLSSWFQDYVFVPLYLKFSKIRSIASMPASKGHILAFIISIIIGETLLGLWHGAKMTFVMFGLYYGIMISVYYLFRKYWDSMNKFLQIILTFILVNIGWVFFRANNLIDSLTIIKRIITAPLSGFAWVYLGLSKMDLVIVFLVIIGVSIWEIIVEILNNKGEVININDWWKIITIILLIIMIIVFGSVSISPFLYFQF